MDDNIPSLFTTADCGDLAARGALFASLYAIISARSAMDGRRSFNDPD